MAIKQKKQNLLKKITYLTIPLAFIQQVFCNYYKNCKINFHRNKTTSRLRSAPLGMTLFRHPVLPGPCGEAFKFFYAKLKNVLTLINRRITTQILCGYKDEDNRIAEKINVHSIYYFTNKLRAKKITDDDINIIEKLLLKFYSLHRQNKKKLLVFYSISLITAIIAGLITSFIFPSIFKSNAATYEWTQTSWIGGSSLDTAIHSSNQSNWDKYFEKNENLTAMTELTLSLAASSTSQTSIADFSAGEFSDTAIYGDGTNAAVLLNVNSALDWSENCKKSTYNTPGNASNVFTNGNYAYIADGTSGLQIINISNPESPIFVGNYDTASAAKDVYVSGNYAYIADYTSGLQIINISNPQNPSLAGFYDTAGYANGVYVYGNYVYIADRTAGLQIINISNPASPALISTFPTTDARDVYISGNYAFVADYSSGLRIIDISDPENPSSAGAYNTPGYAYSVYIASNYCYVADYTSGVQIIDISNPLNPSFAANYDSMDETYGVYIEGNYAYIADNDSGLQIINITDPFSPQFEGFYDTLGNATGVYISGNYAYIADNLSGIQIIDITSPLILSQIGSYNTAGNSYQLDIAGNYAYIADGDSGISILDISDPTSPSLSASYDTTGLSYDIFIEGNYGYVADGNAGLAVIDISNPLNPSQLSSYNTTGSARSVFVSGNYAYIADYLSGLQIINISDPSNPAFAGSYNTSGFASGVYVAGNYAYVADYALGLAIIDISNPQSPSLTGSYDTSGFASGVYVAGNYAYVADYGSGLAIIDISTPQNPSLAGSYATVDYAMDVQIFENYAYIANYNSGVKIIDVSNPAIPHFVHFYDTVGIAYGIKVLQNYIYLADFSDGFKIITTGDYLSSGTFTSSVIDTSISGNSWANATWNANIPNDTEIILKVKSSPSADISDITNCDAITTITSANSNSESSLSGNECVNNGDRYIQYQILLSTTNAVYSPMMENISLFFNYYPSQNLISSAYNTGAESNAIGKIEWNENIPSGTDIKFQIRTSPDNSVWTDWLGPTGIDDYYIDMLGNTSINAAHSAGNNDRWIQYKVFLESYGQTAPILYDVSLSYAVNAAPEFNPDYPALGNGGMTASSTSSNLVNIVYSIKDPDSSEGTVTPNFVAPFFYYSTNNGELWNIIESGMNANATSSKFVEENSYTQYFANWNATEELAGIYSEEFKIKVVADDGEIANNTAYASSTPFIIDFKAPSSLSIIIDNGKTHASSALVELLISASDDVMSEMRMMLSNDASFTDAVWENYNENKSWELEGENGEKTVYIKFKDWRENVSSIANDTIIFDTTAPNIPSNLAIRDISNYASSEYRLFITWEIGDDPGDFLKYNVWRTTDENDFGEAPYQIISNRLTNYIIETGLSAGETYYYKISSQDTQNNISNFSAVVSDTADGQGGTDATPPLISNVAISDISDTSAIISWTTDELSNSAVNYSTSAQELNLIKNIDSMQTSHSTTLNLLSPSLTYYFKVKSTDPSNNFSTDDNNGNYYNFSTLADSTGPSISSAIESDITSGSAKISWTTDEPATSQIQYGIQSGTLTLSTSLNQALSLSHLVELSGLSENTIYYYKIISNDEQGNSGESAENNFSTVYSNSSSSENTATGGGILIIDKTDKKQPKISNIKISDITATSATISWTTDEAANSFVEFSNSPAESVNAVINESYFKTYGSYEASISHSVILENLYPNAIHSYKILSADVSGNLAKSENLTFTTLETVANEETKHGKILGKSEINKIAEDAEDANNLFERAAKKIIDIINKTASSVSIGILEKTLSTQYEKIKEIAEIIPPPSLESEPYIKISYDSAEIYWKTDKEANSLIFYSPENLFNKKNEYNFIAGNDGEFSKIHTVALHNLNPDTIYHYQIKSAPIMGKEARSKDFTFKTSSQILEIIDYKINALSSEKVIFKWKTNLETTSVVKYIPYRDNNLMVGETKIASSSAMAFNHEILVEDLESGVIYDTTIYGETKNRQSISKSIPAFSASEDDLPPVIYQLQTESAISPGKNAAIQSIISWKTNEAATSRLYFTEGISYGETFTEQTELNKNYSKKHVIVITKFKPGAVYSFRAESIDSNGNMTLSKTFSILTPRQQESIFQIILKNFEKTFSWIGLIGITAH
ncbi:MAG: fibronectin type III domain-containing protein [bacterium]